MAYWANSDPLWGSLTATQKAAAMALMEADNMDMTSATNVLGAIVNRAQRDGADLGRHVSGKIYQPTIEDSQRARLSQIVQTPQFQQLTDLAARRQAGEVADWVGGATHFLAPPKTMLALEAKEPDKYKNWGPRGANWTGYDPATGQYANTVMSDKSHVFLSPEGKAAGSSAPTPAPVPSNSQEPKEMLPLFAMLANSGMTMGGLGAGGATAGASAIPSAAGGGLGNIFGSLTGGKGFAGEPMSGGGTDALASNAMKAASGDAETAIPRGARPSVDMSQLTAMLKNAGYLGTSLPRRT